jgi:hypothetical protein
MKVICVKKCSYRLGQTDYPFNIGEQYQVSIRNSYLEDKIFIHLYENSISIITVLKSDFITLEQWREQQLDKLI